jgi:hypothetical protein
MTTKTGINKRSIAIITSILTIIGMIVTGVWQLDARMDNKIEKELITFEQKAGMVFDKIQRTQDIRYYNLIITTLTEKKVRLEEEIKIEPENPNNKLKEHKLGMINKKIDRYQDRLDRLLEE